jgi:hypothetical protein
MFTPELRGPDGVDASALQDCWIGLGKVCLLHSKQVRALSRP